MAHFFVYYRPKPFTLFGIHQFEHGGKTNFDIANALAGDVIEIITADDELDVYKKIHERQRHAKWKALFKDKFTWLMAAYMVVVLAGIAVSI